MLTAHVELEIDERALKRAQDEMSNGVWRAVQAAAKAATAEAKNLAPRGKTGKLKDGIRYETFPPTATEATAWILSDAPYSAYVEEGTKAHWIRPKAGHGSMGPLRRGQSRRSKTDIGTHRVCLRFTVNGTTFFRPVVWHPGTTSQPFFGPAYLKAESVLWAELEKGVVAAQQHLG